MLLFFITLVLDKNLEEAINEVVWPRGYLNVILTLIGKGGERIDHEMVELATANGIELLTDSKYISSKAALLGEFWAQ